MKLSVTEIKANFYELMELVSRGKKLTVTRYGRPVAHLVPPDKDSVRRALQKKSKLSRGHKAEE